MALSVVSTTGCADVNDDRWTAPSHFDEWITSNRSIDATHHAAAGMAVTCSWWS